MITPTACGLLKLDELDAPAAAANASPTGSTTEEVEDTPLGLAVPP